MGSYSILYMAGKELCSKKHGLDHMVMTLFQPSERLIKRGTVAEVAADMLDEDGENADEQIELLTYETTLGVFKDRLELMGFSLEFVRGEFERGKQRELEQMESNEESREHYATKSRAIKELTFERWLSIFERSWKFDEKPIQRELGWIPQKDCSMEELLDWYVEDNSYDYPYGFPNLDLRLFLRIVCEVLPQDSSVIYDLSELIDESDGDAKELAEFAEQYLDGGYATTRRIIVLTEGRTDQRVIEGSLKLLRPGLQSYFSFLDFETLAIPGGVIPVLNTLKALVSVGIANRIVALLDNDTAAHSAVQAAKLGTLPGNVRVVFLPHLPFAESYPTLGPTGMTAMDINGLACSVELFFGEDVLRAESSELVPIQWKGYDDKLKRYQGEIMRKADLQALFSRKLEKARDNPDFHAGQDWASMNALVQVLITAFHDVPPLDYGLEETEEY